MESRFEEIEKFLKKLASNGITSKDDIYLELCNYDLSDNDKGPKNSLVEDKDKLISLFKRNRKIYRNIRKIGKFLYFRNMDGEHNTDEYIKLYIPTNKDEIQDLVPKLLDFITSKNIMHSSKISDNVRSDDIVSRVVDEESARKIIEYVNNNLSDKVIKTNPFVMREGVVGIASDGMLSYNERVSGFLSDYLSQNQDNLDNVNLDGFREFIHNVKDKISNDKDFVSRILLTKDIQYVGRTSDLGYLYDCKNILNLLELSLDKEKGYGDFEKFWQSINDEQVKEKNKQEITDILNAPYENKELALELIKRDKISLENVSENLKGDREVIIFCYDYFLSSQHLLVLLHHLIFSYLKY